MKEKRAEQESQLDFSTKNLNRLEEEHKWSQRELEKVKLEYSD